MKMYLLSFLWLLLTVGIIIGYVCVLCKDIFPHAISDLYLFGKSRNLKGYGLTNNIFQVPKRWFYHFYLIGILVNTCVLAVTIYTFITSGQWPYWFQIFFNHLGHYQGTGTVDPWPVLLALSMLEVQILRRLLECLLVNSYSDSYMSVVIYFVGVLFYSSAGISVAAMSKTHILQNSDLNLTWYQILSLVVFVWASLKQYKLNKIMSKLRRGKHGSDTKHHLPHGDWFNYCSCPHFFMEIIIYASISTLLTWEHEICFCLFIFVLSNQLIAGWLSHSWYKQNFRNYPKSRTAVIPYIF